MRYIPHDQQDVREILQALQLRSFDDLFKTLPAEICFPQAPQVIGQLSEQEIYAKMARLAARNQVAAPENGWLSFLGAGSYQHYIPAAVDGLAGRAEYFTSYTPYQPELSQGNLQAGFEFQSLIANLLGMDVANASMYDGGNALAEAVFMARRIRTGNKVLVSTAIHPHYREVLKTYASNLFEVIELPIDNETGRTQLNNLAADADCFAIALQSPNFFGCIEDLGAFATLAKEKQLISIVCSNELIAYGTLRPPGAYDVDIVCGEGQSLGNPVMYGGPHLGILAARKQHLRTLPGRLVGRTTDSKGQTGYVLTLSTREQHIRRERATSNICTNQFLLALRAAIYMAFLGEKGMQQVAFENAERQAYLQKKLAGTALTMRFSAPTFNECTIKLPAGKKTTMICEAMAKQQVIAGLPLDEYGQSGCLLVSVSELHSHEEIDTLINRLAKAVTDGK